MEKYSHTVGRILLAIIFLLAGIGKIGSGFGLGFGYEGTAGFMASGSIFGIGVPGGLLVIVILVEVLGGLALIAGFQTKTAALILAVFTLLAALIYHMPLTSTDFLKNLAITGGLLLLFVHGAGDYSIDNKKE
ncbi:DoxX family protein [Gammaproteobacteria bacterium]|jgi:putative oxidoreductase|nr:DoxX family protein [Gammaproteobacteria bacterium]